MELNEKLKKYRKEAGLSQEELASKIFVSRTLITKYEGGSAFPTQENLNKIADALNIEVDELLSDKEREEIVERSYKRNHRLWMVLGVCFAMLSLVMLLLSIIPFYQYVSYDYSVVSFPDNPTPARVIGHASIIGATLRVGNPISVINIVLLVACLATSFLSFVNFSNKALKVIRIASVSLFAASVILFFFSFAAMASIVGAPGFK